MIKRSECKCLCHTDAYRLGCSPIIQHIVPCCEEDRCLTVGNREYITFKQENKMKDTIILIDDNDGDTRVQTFTGVDKMLAHAEGKNLKYIKVYKIEEELKLKKRSSVIIEYPDNCENKA